MKTRLTPLKHAALLLLLLTLNPQLSTLRAQGSSIGSLTYQGRLNGTNGPANGLYDFSFALFTASTGGSQISTTISRTFLPVTNGLFTILLDFPGASNFPGADRWLEIAVHPSGVGTNITLSPRQQITAAPYAITAGNVISGGLAPGTYGNAVTFNNANNNFSGAFTGNGAGVSNVNAVTLNGISSSGFWKTNGNTGANPTNGAFLGTADNLPLEFRVNGARALRLEPTAYSTEVNVIGGSVGNAVINGASGATVWGGGFDGTNNNGNIVSGNFGTVSGGRQNSANNAETTVAGGRANAANGSNSTVSGGYANLVTGSYGSIAGGEFNSLTDSDYGAIGGGFQNTIQSNSIYATISGGGANIILSNSPRGTIGGGIVNTVGATEGTVAGGAFNSALAFSATIGGGGGNAASGGWATIAGGRANLLTNADYATIGGGYLNTIQPNSPYAAIAGGVFNTIQTNSDTSLIAGGHNNTIQSAAHSAIGGGGYNTIEFNAHDSVIGGGGYNTIQTNADSSVIGGGGVNLIQSDASYSIIGGGLQNTILNNSSYSTIGGGYQNTIQTNAYDSIIGGGVQNTIQPNSYYSTIGGGLGNTIQPNAYSTIIGGGNQNMIQTNATYSTIGGGGNNTIQTYSGNSTIAGGVLNTIQPNATDATIGGGHQNIIQTGAFGSTIPGGWMNSAAASFAFAAGRSAKANHTGAFVWADSTGADFASTAGNQFLIRAGGGVGINKNNPATALDVNGTVTATSFSGSGASLTGLNAAGLTGTVPAASLGNAWQIGGNGGTTPGTHFLGTTDNQALELKANGARALRLEPNLTSPNLVGGSPVNVVTNGYFGAVIGGGGAVAAPNRIGASYASVLGGYGNTASGSYASVLGGSGNTASSDYSVAMGLNTTARGLYSTAMGRSTVAANDDATAMGLGCSALGWDTVAMGTFSVAGGHYSLAAGYYSQATNQSAFVWSDSSAIPGANSLANNSVTMRASGGYRLFSNSGSTAGVSLAANGTAWAVISDRNVKKDFSAVDSVQILEKLAAMPITQWHYKWETSDVTPHIGPMAQDFKAAFYPGTDDKSITTQEADGVALAAIQGLNQKLEEQRAENAELKKRLERLEQLMNQKTPK